MAFIISKIIGDGQTPETAYRIALQDYEVRILSGGSIPVDPKTGIPASDFALMEVHDDDLPVVEATGCFVVPKDGLDKARLSKALADQGCVLDVAAVRTPQELVAVVSSKVLDEYAVKAK